MTGVAYVLDAWQNGAENMLPIGLVSCVFTGAVYIQMHSVRTLWFNLYVKD